MILHSEGEPDRLAEETVGMISPNSLQYWGSALSMSGSS